MLSRRRIVAGLAVGAFAFGGVIPRALAQATDKLVRMIVGFPAGGGTDVTARVLAEALRGTYASTIIVENKAGASARLAVEYVKNAPPDGSVMLFTPDFPMTLYPHSFKSLSYDPLQDFIAVSPAAKGMLTFVVGPAVPDTVKTLADFVQWCKAHPESATYATTAAGGTPHFVGVMLASAAGIAMTPVHYRGGAPALQDLIGGHVPAGVNPISETLSLAKSGTLRILAVTGARRSPFLPEVPTLKESGIDVQSDAWNALIAPGGTPPSIIATINAEVRQTLSEPAVVEKLKFQLIAPAPSTPEQLRQKMADEKALWADVIRAANIRIE